MHVALLTTGGTIASTDTPGEMLTANDLLETVPELEAIGDVTTREVFSRPSLSIGIRDMFDLLSEIRSFAGRSDVDAVIVTHGTDTLEETAYFVDLCYDMSTPVVFTGGMRKPTHPGADGPANLLAAVRFADHESAREAGVLVAFSDRAYPAREVTKAHTTAVDAFTSPEYGPIATLTEDRVRSPRRPVDVDRSFDPDRSELNEDVVILTASAGMSSRLVDAAEGAAGIVVAGTGGGHLTTSAIEPLEAAADGGTPIVVTTRCTAGDLLRNSYTDKGTEATLQRLGAFYTDLRPWKARIKFMVADASDVPVAAAFDRPTDAISGGS